ncbi:MAG: transcription elongation factor GreA [Streptosporangiales bacterium]|nr:transcription elongation factor GreA [Streptosporangiales bacterium]
MTHNSVNWLTQEAYDRLKEELDHLTGPGRTELAKKIEEARAEGDLRENGGYHAAKEEQGKAEGRIRQLQDMLRNAEVGQKPADSGVVEPGMQVTVQFPDGDEMSFLLGSREVAADGIEAYSVQSPLGSAINGKKIGDKAAYTLPNGSEMAVTVTEAKPFAA